MGKISSLFIGLACSVLASFCLASTAPLKPIIKPDYSPDPATDEGGLWYKVGKFEKELATAPSLIREPELNAYISDITCKLAGEYCSNIRVYLIHNPHFNASMAPNGMMHVWSGLLLRVENEDQLAVVLGHEIGHYLRAHSITQWRKIRDGLATSLIFDMLLGGLATLATAGNLMSFSRQQETEADLYGLQLLEKNGYDPHASYKLWQYLELEEASDTSKRESSFFFATHPKIENRINKLKQSISAKVSNKPKGKNKLVQMVSPYYFEFMSQHMQLRDYGRAEELLERHKQLGYPLAEVLFFYGELHKLRNQENDKDRAVDFYRASINESNPPPQAYRELGYLLMKSGLPEAKTHFSNYLKHSPNAADAAMVKFYLNK